MIKSIHIKDVASYGASPEKMNDLAQINFIYGSNGTGKTTISRIIAEAQNYPQCLVTWQNGAPLEAFVYNRDFVDKNLNQPNELKGIFTLGEKHKENFERIKLARQELDGINRFIAKLRDSLEGTEGNGGKVEELTRLENEFAEECWKIKQKYDARFQGAFAGVRNSKRDFKRRLLRESLTNSAASCPFDDLERRAETVFAKIPQLEETLTVPNSGRLLAHESNPILKKEVVGRSDVDLATMINRLGNSDWVNQGRKYYDPDEQVCPFCQQITDPRLEKSLNDYFDKAFMIDSEAIERLQSEYRADSEHVQQVLQALLDNPSKRLDATRLQNQKSLIDSKIRLNLQHIERKRRESSILVELESLRENLDAIKNLVEAANTAIRTSNKLAENIQSERTILTEQVWRYLLDNEIKDALASYNRKKAGIDAAITSLQEKISNKT